MTRDLVPLSLGDILDEAFDLYKGNFAVFAGIVAALHVPAHFVWLAVYYGLGLDRITAIEGDTAAEVWAGLLAAAVWMGMALLYTFLAVVQNGALALAISERYLDRQVTVSGAYRRTVGRLPVLLVTWALVFGCVAAAASIVASGGSVAMALAMIPVSASGDGGAAAAVALAVAVLAATVVVSVLVAVWLGMFVTQAVVIEGRSVGPALTRNAQLVKGQVLRTGGAAIAMVVLSGAVMLAVTQSVNLALEYLVYAWLFVPTGAREAVGGAVTGCVWILLQPFWMTCLTLLYYDRRVRREGFDLALLEHQLAPTTPVGRA